VKKIAQKLAHHIFLSIRIHNVYRRKTRSPSIIATLVIFKQMPKENKRPLGENSPNLVALVWTMKCALRARGLRMWKVLEKAAKAASAEKKTLSEVFPRNERTKLSGRRAKVAPSVVTLQYIFGGGGQS
jgi:hypothetical protein